MLALGGDERRYLNALYVHSFLWRNTSRDKWRALINHTSHGSPFSQPVVDLHVHTV